MPKFVRIAASVAILCAGTALSVAQSRYAVTDFDMRLVAFDKPYTQFIQRFCGWQNASGRVAPCDPRMGTIDRKAFERSRDAACKLYRFESCK